MVEGEGPDSELDTELDTTYYYVFSGFGEHRDAKEIKDFPIGLIDRDDHDSVSSYVQFRSVYVLERGVSSRCENEVVCGDGFHLCLSEFADDVSELPAVIASVVGEVCNDLFEGKVEWYALSCDEVNVV